MNRFSIRSKILGGILLVAGLQVAAAFVGWRGRQRLVSEFDLVQKIEQTRAEGLKIEFDVQEMRLRVDRYIASGQASLPSIVRTIHKRICDRLEIARNQTSDSDIMAVFERIEAHSQEYMSQFELALKERQLRQKLVSEQLPKMANRVEAGFTELEIQIEQSTMDSSNQLKLSKCHNSFQHSRRSLLSYFENTDSRHGNDAIRHANQTRAGVKVLDIPKETKKELVDNLDTYTQFGIRAIQATRAYLYLKNVVMAAEQSEVSFHARRLRGLTHEKRSNLIRRVEATHEQVQWFNGSVSVTVLALSVCIALWLISNIIPPLDKLTHTFKRLSSGATVGLIPCQHRQDEIGQMAIAAKVFSDQNGKTKQLLKASEILATDLETKKTDLEQINEELDHFAYVASHDLKSPLRGIRQLASWIEEDSAHLLPEESIVHLQKLQSRITKMESLLQELLDFSRMGRTQWEATDVNLDRLLTEVIDLIDTPEIISVTWERNLPNYRLQELPLKQVLINLIGNAVKYNDKKEQGRVSVSISFRESFLEFTVADNGAGIDKSNHERIFQLYQRVGISDEEGSGMGLAIVKKHVQQVGGNISVESDLGKGSAFRFDWPAIEIPRPPITSMQQQEVCYE